MAHERTFNWTDFREVARGMAGRPHLEWMQAMIAGEIPPPPLGSAFEFAFETAEPGRVTFSVAAHEWAANPAGVVHGGFISTLLDTVLTLCVQTKLPQDRLATTTDLHVRFVRPATPNGQRLRAEATAVHIGSTMATAEGRVYDAAGKMVAHGTTALAIIAFPGASDAGRR
ncbi:MAG TPA: PaaI family thioesterase [Candidatus Baltobacteraceae bacterium]|nr:PaaI family thioesterase [Candidatus Baltobacteraceae bacterium]